MFMIAVVNVTDINNDIMILLCDDVPWCRFNTRINKTEIMHIGGVGSVCLALDEPHSWTCIKNNLYAYNLDVDVHKTPWNVCIKLNTYVIAFKRRTEFMI